MKGAGRFEDGRGQWTTLKREDAPEKFWLVDKAAGTLAQVYVSNGKERRGGYRLELIAR